MVQICRELFPDNKLGQLTGDNSTNRKSVSSNKMEEILYKYWGNLNVYNPQNLIQ